MHHFVRQNIDEEGVEVVAQAFPFGGSENVLVMKLYTIEIKGLDGINSLQAAHPCQHGFRDGLPPAIGLHQKVVTQQLPAEWGYAVISGRALFRFIQSPEN